MYVFVVPGNSQVLLGMPDTAALKITNPNIDSIQVEVAECKTNTKQEMHMVAKACANTDAGVKTKQDANGQYGQNNTNISINYLFSSSNVDEDKRKYMTHFGMYLMVLGALKAHSLCNLSPTAGHTRCHPGM